ncbi:histidinol-phosphatase [Desulfovibrio sp. OttesenSCG-928-A18]|nr:histidinol-phosphatase [Desulfovibrio sp. OttesenSCG-928-A18]
MHSSSAPKNGLPILADIHLHTRHSHGQASTAEMLQAARGRGLSVIGFSEHSPRPDGYRYPTDYQEKLRREFGQYIEEVTKLARLSEDSRVTVLLGLELDYIPAREDYAAELSRSHDYDYVIGGLHFQDDWGFDYSPDDWARMDEGARFAAYERYYHDLTAMCRSGLFHVAAHPDLIKIFSIQSFRAWLERPAAIKAVSAALTAMKEAGVILEISSAGLRKPCAEIYPGPKIMNLAAAMDLPISFASDAHCINTPAHAFDELARYAWSFGYRQHFVVQKGKRVPMSFSRPGPFANAANITP